MIGVDGFVNVRTSIVHAATLVQVKVRIRAGSGVGLHNPLRPALARR